jgi:hypothetical protein
MRPLTSVPEERETITARPNSAKENISAGPNMRESLARGGERNTNVNPDTIAPRVEPNMEALKARVAFPFFDSAYPSRAVAADAGVPGMLSVMAGMDPAYVPAFQMAIRKRMPISAGKIKVSGSKMVMAAAAVKPGIAPNMIPIITPTSMARRFCQ